MTYTISKDFEFSASHQLVGLPEDHPCSRLHGHNYTVRLSLTGTLDSTGFVFDYRKLARFKEHLDENYDHYHLNDVVQGNPTAERLADALTLAASERLTFPPNVFTVQVSVSETGKTWATAEPLRVATDVHALDGDRYRWGTEHHSASVTLTGEGSE